MIRCNQGDIILIPFPFTDLSALKQRPAVVISSNKFNHAGRDVIVAAITSQIPKRFLETDIVLTPLELKMAGLPKASITKINKIATIDKRLIRKKLGLLPKESIRKLSAPLQYLFSSPS